MANIYIGVMNNNFDYDIVHHGAVNGVTGSCHELRWTDASKKLHGILIDCGLFQGAEVSADGSSFEQLKITFPIKHIQALIVTHVHIDHVGRIPYLLAAGFKGPIICTKPSAALLPLVLEDALKIGFTRNKRLIDKFLYQISQQLKPVDYKNWYPIAQNHKHQNARHHNSNHLNRGQMTPVMTAARVKLQPAGHILGSAYVEIDLKNNGRHRITFSGDLGPPYTPLLNAPKSPYRTDELVLESTYGDKQHESRKKRVAQLKQVIEKCISNRGVVLIPAFSIGRTQELLYEIEQIINKNPQNKAWQDIEVIMDSPLAAKFTQVYRKLRKYWDKEARNRINNGRHPLSFSSLLTIDDHQTHQQTVKYLKKTARPTIILAASGMCSGGRIVNYLKALIQDQRTDILFVGYQAQGTAGNIIQRYGPKNGYVELEGRKYDINAGVYTIGGYSAHADQKDLMNFVKRMRVKPKKIRLIHGDERAKKSLKRKLKQQFSGINIFIP